MEEVKIPDYIEKLLKKNPITINLYPGDTRKTFKSFRSLYNFIQNENIFWSKYNEKRIDQIKNAFLARIQELKKNLTNKNESEILTNITNFAVGMNYKQPQPVYIFSTTQFGKYIQNILEQNLNLDTIWNYLFRELPYRYSNLSNLPQIDLIRIAIQGSKILNNENQISDRQILLEYNSVISNYESNRDTIANEIVEIKNQKDEIISEFSTKSNTILQNEEKKFSAQYESEKNKFEELTKLYTEKLRISGPAEYWKKFKNKYRYGGIVWIGLSICVVVAIIFIAFHLLENLPDQLFTPTNTNTNTKSISIENIIKWTILLALIFSALIFLLRLFVKLGLSAFHLSRDVNERLQLTHQYLALLKEGVIEEKHREIIIQSLFSRAETGLLKGDSSPAFPSGLLSQIVNAVKT